MQKKEVGKVHSQIQESITYISFNCVVTKCIEIEQCWYFHSLISTLFSMDNTLQ